MSEGIIDGCFMGHDGGEDGLRVVISTRFIVGYGDTGIRKKLL